MRRDRRTESDISQGVDHYYCARLTACSRCFFDSTPAAYKASQACDPCITLTVHARRAAIGCRIVHPKVLDLAIICKRDDIAVKLGKLSIWRHGADAACFRLSLKYHWRPYTLENRNTLILGLLRDLRGRSACNIALSAHGALDTLSPGRETPSSGP